MKKRIALAAVAALAGGLLVAAPASAVPNETDTLTSGYVMWEGATVAGPSNFVLLSVNETATNTMAGARVELSGSTILAVTDNTGDSITASQVSSTVAIIGQNDVIKVAVTANGTITANVFWGVSTGVFAATAQVATYVVAAPPAAAVYNHTTVGAFAASVPNTYSDAAGNLFASRRAGILNVPETVTTFTIKQYTSATDDTLSVDSSANVKPVTVSLSGVGVISDGTNNNVTYIAYSGSTLATKNITVSNDGRSGVATITIAVDGVVLKTKTVTFYGPVAKYTASVNSAQHQVGDSLTVTVKSFDSNGIAVPGAPYAALVGDTATVTPNAGNTPGAEIYTVYSAVKYARTITVGNGSAETATVVANFVTAGVATVAIAADTATYAPGAKATFTLTAKNSDGVVAGDATYALTVGGSTALFGVPATVSVVNGVGTFTAYMPVVQGPVVVTASLAGSTAGSVSVAVVDAAAAAQAAAITALQTSVATLTTTVASLVASMTAQIKVINATMLKIQKALVALRLKVNRLR